MLTTRRFLESFAVASIALPLALAAGCSKKEDKAPPQKIQPAPAQSAKAPEPTKEPAVKTEPTATTTTKPADDKGAATKTATPPPAAAQADPTQAPPDVAAPPADATKTESGLAYKILQAGPADAPKPTKFDTVKVHYTGWTTDGKMFDSSIKRGQPAQFPLRGVIPGWTEGLQLMKKGEKARFWIPDTLAYKGRPGPQGTLVFDVELLDIIEGPKPIPAPEDVAKPPADAKKTESGLAYKILKEAPEGAKKPAATDRVKVHYTGWTTDGEMFDSSVVRGRPATFPLNRVIPGWTEGVQLIGVGGKARLWIPEELAYKGRQGAPQGMLVFDVELLEIVGQ